MNPGWNFKVTAMSKGIFIVGTDTDVGKSVVTAGLVYMLRKAGYNACSFKAVQSGGVFKQGRLISEDTHLVQKICDLKENQELMNPYCLETPVSPHLAARLEKVTIQREHLLEAYQRLAEKYDYIVAEGAGGLVVPLIENDYMIYDLIRDLNLPVLIIGRAKVGTINHTTLTVEFAKKLGLDLRGIILNRYTDTFYEQDNIQTIENLTGKQVITVIHELNNFDHTGDDFQALKTEFENQLSIEQILSLF